MLKREKELDKIRRDALRVQRLEEQKKAYAHRLQVHYMMHGVCPYPPSSSSHAYHSQCCPSLPPFLFSHCLFTINRLASLP